MLYVPRLLRYLIGDRIAVEAEEMYGAFGHIVMLHPFYAYEYGVHIDGVADTEWMFNDWELQPVKGRVSK